MNFDLAKSLSVYETFSSLYKVLKLFGMMPFEMNLKTGEVSVKYRDLLWMFITWMLWTYLIAWNAGLGAREPGEVSKIILWGWHWLLLFQLAAGFFVQMVSFVRRKSIARLFSILNEVDQMVSDLHVGDCLFTVCLKNLSMKYQEDHLYVKDFTTKFIVGSTLLIIFMHIYTSVAVATNDPDSDHGFVMLSSYSFVTLIFSFIYQQFIFATSNIRSRFNLLNSNLRFVLCRKISF
jgi:hypothetical protein